MTSHPTDRLRVCVPRVPSAALLRGPHPPAGGDLCLDSAMSPNTLVRGPNPPRPQKAMHLEMGLLQGGGGDIQSQRGLGMRAGGWDTQGGTHGRTRGERPRGDTGRRRPSASQGEASGDTPPACFLPPGRRGNKSVSVSSYISPHAHPLPALLKPALALCPPSAPQERTLPYPALGPTLN